MELYNNIPKYVMSISDWKNMFNELILVKLNLSLDLFFYLTSSENITVASRFQLHSDIHNQ